MDPASRTKRCQSAPGLLCHFQHATSQQSTANHDRKRLTNRLIEKADKLAEDYPLPKTLLEHRALEVHRLRGHNRAAVALANKLARIIWAVWRHDTRFESRPVTA